MFVVLLFCLIACGKTKTNQELYQGYREKNITECTSVMVKNGYDSIEAEAICSCLFDTAYSKNSTFIKMNEQEQNDFINKNNIQSVCDSLGNILPVR
jgi:hypothetical protein